MRKMANGRGKSKKWIMEDMEKKARRKEKKRYENECRRFVWREMAGDRGDALCEFAASHILTRRQDRKKKMNTYSK